MTKNTESLIFACHELARVASCDDYLTLNEIADKLKSLHKERDRYKQMFFSACKDVSDITDAMSNKEIDDTDSVTKLISEIKLLKKKIRFFELGLDALEPMISLAQSLQNKSKEVRPMLKHSYSKTRSKRR